MMSVSDWGTGLGEAQVPGGDVRPCGGRDLERAGTEERGSQEFFTENRTAVLIYAHVRAANTLLSEQPHRRGGHYPATIALNVGVWENTQEREHNRLSVMPHLQLTAEFRRPEADTGDSRHRH